MTVTMAAPRGAAAGSGGGRPGDPHWLTLTDRPSSQRFEEFRAQVRSSSKRDLLAAVDEDGDSSPGDERRPIARVANARSPLSRFSTPPRPQRSMYERDEEGKLVTEAGELVYAESPDKALHRRVDSSMAVVPPVGKRYITPFIACKECNHINMIDNVLLVRAIHDRDFSAISVLPACLGCGTTLDIGLGPEDHTDIIEGKRRAKIEFQKLQKRSAMKMQRAWRGMVGRREARKVKERHEAWLKQIDLAALKFQTQQRARVGRHVARVEKALLRIKNTVRSVLHEALKAKSTDGKKRHIWWYKRKAELELIYRDYREFVERTGRQPPQHVVEANILEIAARIAVIEAKAAVLIQSLFRGVVGRMFVKELIQEMARLRSVRSTATIIVQRWWRSIIAFRALEQLRFERRTFEIKREYLREKKAKMRAIEDEGIRVTAMKHYKKEVRESRVAVVTGKTSYHEYGGRKLLAYHKSAYGGDPTASRMVSAFLARRAQDRRREERQTRYKVERNRYIDGRIKYKQGFSKFFVREHLGKVDEEERLRNIKVNKSQVAFYTPLHDDEF